MKRLGLFQSRSLNFAIPLLQIQKIVQGLKGFLLPRLPEAVFAVIVDDKHLVPVLDLGQVMGTGGCADLTDQAYQVFIETDYGPVVLPADLTGQIVAEKKGHVTVVTVKDKCPGVVGKFIYQSEEYNILDIDYLAIEMTQGFWQSQPDTGGAGRHQ